MAKKSKSQPKSKSQETACEAGVFRTPADLPEPVKQFFEKEGIPPHKIIAAISQTMSQTMSFSSPYPPPEVLKQYQQIDPRLVETIINQMEEEREHRHNMDKAAVGLKEGDLEYKRRGQTIAAVLTPGLIVLLAVFIYLTVGQTDMIQALRIFLWFIAVIAGLFLTGRVMTGLENIFGKKE